MRGIIQDKVIGDHANQTKEKEKSKALFHEVVRLGENLEKNDEFIHNLTSTLENRLKTLEEKINTGERALGLITNIGDNSLSALNDWNDKIEKKVQNFETHLLNFGVINFYILMFFYLIK